MVVFSNKEKKSKWNENYETISRLSTTQNSRNTLQAVQCKFVIIKGSNFHDIVEKVNFHIIDYFH